MTRRQVEINVLGVIFGTKLALNGCCRGVPGIINTASLAGELAVPGLATYCGTKFAVIGSLRQHDREYPASPGSSCPRSGLRSPTPSSSLGRLGPKGLRNAEPEGDRSRRQPI